MPTSTVPAAGEPDDGAPSRCSTAARAQELLAALAGPGAVLRDDQAAAIAAVVDQRRRTLVVQRTGFGKSAIYFIAARMLRDAGAGPTLLVSPLLALMRDQVAAAEHMGVRSATINSTNIDDWAAIEAAVAADEVDLLCISPERLNSPGFARRVLPGLAAGLGLLVVDEAHCISDWGHDFRPDYRRIRDAIAALPHGTPVVATTATANARVTSDIAEQLGDDVAVLRGPLDRPSLHLGVARLPDAAHRLAWVADRLPRFEGTGIVYCLTVAQTALVAGFLGAQGIDAHAYSSDTPTEERARLEAAFKANEVKALVATSALGMGVDKPDVAFVVHLGAPPSPIAYYQQVGRAGRSLDRAEAWLLPSEEDRRIWDWFAAVGLPPEPLVRRVLDALGREPLSLPALEAVVDLRRTRLETLLKILDVDGAVTRVDGGWVRTEATWSYDHERVDRVRAARADEADAMVRYASGGSCLMRFLRTALDDPADDCGRCSVCTGAPAGAAAPPEPRAAADVGTGSADVEAVPPALVAAAVTHLRGIDVVLDPRRQWARGLDEPRGNLKPAQRADHGRALARVGDAGWWPAVAAALDADAVDDELLGGVVAMLERWRWVERPRWVTPVPSVTHPGLVEGLARRIAEVGRLEVVPALARTRAGAPQAELENSAHRLANVWGALAVDPSIEVPMGPGLLVDDVWDSGWTMTVAAHLLRSAGAEAVLPVVLARA